MGRQTGRSMARGTTVTFVLAGLLLAAACGHKTSAQTLRPGLATSNAGGVGFLEETIPGT
jgi:hypothetical protein